MSRRAAILLLLLGLLAAVAVVLRDRVQLAVGMVKSRVARRTVADRLDEFGPRARQRWKIHFGAASQAYPPKRVIVAVFKKEKRMEIYSAGASTNFIRSIKVLAASGVQGPKLREGDQQVPEGFYKVHSLNPNSLYHVSLRLNYPNPSDLARAKADGRTDLGGDIMIHGKDVSIGCVAVGDEAAEDIFTLAADIGVAQFDVIIAPVDWRKGAEVSPNGFAPPWVAELYTGLRSAIQALPPP